MNAFIALYLILKIGNDIDSIRVTSVTKRGV